MPRSKSDVPLECCRLGCSNKCPDNQVNKEKFKAITKLAFAANLTTEKRAKVFSSKPGRYFT
jgi:hypothetical protein